MMMHSTNLHSTYSFTHWYKADHTETRAWPHHIRSAGIT